MLTSVRVSRARQFLDSRSLAAVERVDRHFMRLANDSIVRLAAAPPPSLAPMRETLTPIAILSPVADAALESTVPRYGLLLALSPPKGHPS